MLRIETLIDVCLLIVDTTKKFLLRAKYHILTYQLQFCLFANDVLLYTEHSKFYPSTSATHVDVLNIDTPSLFQVLTIIFVCGFNHSLKFEHAGPSLYVIHCLFSAFISIHIATSLPFPKMRLRIRHAKGLLTISDVTLDHSVLELKRHISSSIGLAPNQEVESE